MNAMKTLVVVLMAFLVMSMPVLALRDVSGRGLLNVKELQNPLTKEGQASALEDRDQPALDSDRLRDRNLNRPDADKNKPYTRKEAAAKALESMTEVFAGHYFMFSQLVEPIVQNLKECGVSKQEMNLFVQQLNNAKETLGAAQQKLIWAWMNYKYWNKYGVTIQYVKDAKKDWDLFKIQLASLVKAKNVLDQKYGCQ